jgi:hypothetical protein
MILEARMEGGHLAGRDFVDTEFVEHSSIVSGEGGRKKNGSK